MYQRGRPSSGVRRPSRGDGGYARSRARGRFVRQPRRPRFQGANLPISLFISKPVAVTEEAVAFVPEHSFEDFGLNKALLERLRERGYEQPTPIQDKVIPRILQGADIVGLANTGTGKTGAFLIPIIHRMVTVQRPGQLLVIAPTRELALQIDEEFRNFAQPFALRSVVCVGGTGMGQQITKLHRPFQVVIGTPGRLIDVMKRKHLRLGNIHTVVLDEADRMLDMGFIKDIRIIMEQIPADRTTHCFSATMSPNIMRLVKDFLKDPISVSVKTQDTPKNVEQNVVRVGTLDKQEVLHDLLSGEGFHRVLVFGRTKHGVEKLARELRQRGFLADSIHGNKSQRQRLFALKSFKEGRIQILVATDVAARGLDIEDITHVINYELPATYDDYVHRIGRTGRGEKKGKALTFVG